MKSPDGWIGENTLGKIWMKIREEDALKEPENQSRAVDFLVGNTPNTTAIGKTELGCFCVNPKN